MYYALADILGESLEEEEAIDLLRSDVESYRAYLEFPLEEQERVKKFLMGKSGLFITYDSFFKEILDPDMHPARLERFLGAVLGQPVRIRDILPREGRRMSDGGSLVIADIVVELSDGSIVDVEMQKVGIAFPGQRSSCYISDCVMRQYNRVKSIKKKQFSYKDMKPVYMIVLMERSAEEFLNVYPSYMHRQHTVLDSGADIRFLQNVIYISLDTFHSTDHNIDTELEAWLTFFSADDPDTIVKLVNKHTEFREMYRDIMKFRKDPRRLINMYSEALAIMDRNTVEYMCEEMRKKLDQQKETLKEQQREMETRANMISEQKSMISAQESVLSQQKSTISAQESVLSQQKSTISAQESVLSQQKSTISAQESMISQQKSTIARQQETIAEKDAVIAAMQAELERLQGKKV